MARVAYIVCLLTMMAHLMVTASLLIHRDRNWWTIGTAMKTAVLVVILSVLLCAEGAYPYTFEGLPLPSVSYGNFMYREMESTIQKTSESFLTLDIFTSQVYVECAPSWS